MANRTLGLCLIVGCVCIIASVRPANASTPSEAQTLRRIMQEVEELKADEEQDEKKIQVLEQKVGEIQGQNQQLKAANQKLQTDTSAKIETLQTKVDAPLATSQFGDAFDRYLGSHTFTRAGDHFAVDPGRTTGQFARCRRSDWSAAPGSAAAAGRAKTAPQSPCS
jgi:TolA-binding protein